MEKLLNLLMRGSRKATGNAAANAAKHCPNAGRCLETHSYTVQKDVFKGRLYVLKNEEVLDYVLMLTFVRRQVGNTTGTQTKNMAHHTILYLPLHIDAFVGSQ